MTKPIIEIENVGKRYIIGANRQRSLSIREEMSKCFSPKARKEQAEKNEFWALKDVSVKVQQGDTVSIIGRNGAGKSTLLKILSQITPPTEGRITMRGRVASLLEVGTGFHPELTGRENIFLNGAILGMTRKEIQRKFDEIVAFAEIERFLDTPVKRYSSGMYVRLAFAIAAHLEPEILVVDEVLAVGDAEFQKKCLGKMGDVASSGRTILFVSHNMDAVAALCKRVIILRAGQLVVDTTLEEGIKAYLQMAEDDLTIPLIDRPRQQSTSRPPIFVDLSIWGNNGHQNVISTGGSAKFVIELQSYADISKAICAIQIKNSKRQRIALLQTDYHSNLWIKGAQRGTIICQIPSLQLIPGDYFVDLIFQDPMSIIERVEDAGTFKVIFADYLGNGKLPDLSQGNFVLESSWSYSSNGQE